MGVPVSQAEVVTAPSGTGTTITATLPSHQEDDVLIVQFGWKSSQAPQTLTGWNLWFSQATGTATNGCGQGVWWRRVNPSETVANPTLTIGTTAVERRAIAYCIRGADIDNPTNTWWLKQQTTGNSAAPTPPGVTTTAPNYLLLHLVTCRGNSSITPPSGFSEEQDTAEGTTICVEGSTKTQATAGTITGQAATISSNRWVAAIIAIPSPDYAYFRAQTSTTATATSVTGTLPTGTTATDFYGRADVMFAIVKAAGSGIAITPTDAVNWVNVDNWDLDTSTGSDSVEIFTTKYAVGRNLQFTRPTSGVISVQLLTYRNPHQTDWTGNSNARQNSGSPAPFDALTRSWSKSTVLAVIVADADTNAVHTAPSGWTERSDGLGIGSADQIFEAGGSTSSANWTTTNAANVAGVIEVLSHAGAASVVTHERSAAVSASASIASAASFFSVFDRAVVVSASAEIASVAQFFSILERAVSVDASAGVAVSAESFTLFERSASIDATASLTTSAEFFSTFERSSDVAASAAISTSAEFLSIIERGVAIDASATIDTVAHAVLERSVSLSASIVIEVASERVVERSAQLGAGAEIAVASEFFSTVESSAVVDAVASIESSAISFTVIESTVDFSATASIDSSSESFTLVESSAELQATASIDTRGEVSIVVERASSFSTETLISSSGEIDSVGVFERSATLTTTATISTATQRELQRSTAFASTSSISVNAEYFSILERSVNFPATATISVTPFLGGWTEYEAWVGFTATISISTTSQRFIAQNVPARTSVLSSPQQIRYIESPSVVHSLNTPNQEVKVG